MYKGVCAEMGYFMGYIVLGIGIINTIFSIMYAVKMLSKGQQAGIALFFFFCPVAGFLLYEIPLWLLRIQGITSYDREGLVKRLEISQEAVMPVVKKELDVIPVADAMEVGSNTEKRTLLLEQLKKDISSNYKTVLPAGKDRDSESTHYVAAARMEVYRRKQFRLLKAEKEWEEEPENDGKLLCYMQILEEYIDSALLAEKEAKLYKSEYVEKTEKMLQSRSVLLTAEEYGCCLRYLAELGKIDKAEAFWKRIPEEYKKEASYMTMLELYYTAEKKERFYRILDELTASEIRLSAEGLKLLRYWKERR